MDGKYLPESFLCCKIHPEIIRTYKKIIIKKQNFLIEPAVRFLGSFPTPKKIVSERNNTLNR